MTVQCLHCHPTKGAKSGLHLVSSRMINAVSMIISAAACQGQHASEAGRTQRFMATLRDFARPCIEVSTRLPGRSAWHCELAMLGLSCEQLKMSDLRFGRGLRGDVGLRNDDGLPGSLGGLMQRLHLKESLSQTMCVSTTASTDGAMMVCASRCIVAVGSVWDDASCRIALSRLAIIVLQTDTVHSLRSNDISDEKWEKVEERRRRARLNGTREGLFMRLPPRKESLLSRFFLFMVCERIVPRDVQQERGVDGLLLPPATCRIRVLSDREERGVKELPMRAPCLDDWLPEYGEEDEEELRPWLCLLPCETTEG
mmetsp:Transcript_142178/g.261894  ORF Transcript_142178/g.261894 Transcript_142178/m.261894 type:complete len:313 (+) Transcript_142178:112-1050(+)